MKMKDKLVNVDPELGQRLVPIARQERSDADGSGITIGLILSHAQVVGSATTQDLYMVEQHHTNVAHKKSRCVL